MKLSLCPVDLAEANAFVAEHHRHHKPVVGHKFSLGAAFAKKIVGNPHPPHPFLRHDGGDIDA